MESKICNEKRLNVIFYNVNISLSQIKYLTQQKKWEHIIHIYFMNEISGKILSLPPQNIEDHKNFISSIKLWNHENQHTFCGVRLIIYLKKIHFHLKYY